MARPLRFDLPGQPQHVVQRGNNRQPVFFAPSDRAFYLARLREACERYACQIHAYVLMTNHVHMLMSAQGPQGISRTMQFVNSQYAQFSNWRRERTGTLWEGRPHCGVVDTDEYFLVCSRYIELNPVRARLVADPADYAWSSYAANALGREDPLIRTHPLYESMGQTRLEQCAAYRALFDSDLDEALLTEIREATQKGWPIGRHEFRESVGSLTHRRASPLPKGGARPGAGRPRRNQSALTRLIKL